MLPRRLSLHIGPRSAASLRVPRNSASGLCLLIALTFATSAVADQPDPTEQGRVNSEPPTAAVDTAPEPVRPVIWTDPTAMLDAMTEDLKLDETQRLAARQLLTDYRAKQFELRAAFQPSSEFTRQTREILALLRAAQDQSDHDRIRELTEELRKLRAEQDEKFSPIRQQFDEARDNLHRQLRDLLRPDQVDGFEKIWQEKMIERSSGYQGRARSPKALKDAVDKLEDLTPEQNEQLDALFKEYFKAEREAGEDEPARERLAAQLYDSVVKVLTPAQRREIMLMLLRRERPTVPERDAPQGQAEEGVKSP